MTLEPIRQLVADEFEAVDRCIIEQAKLTDVPLIDEIGQHIIQNRGKRLRPLLLLLAGQLTGTIRDQHITMAAVIEFVHIATLLHDDVVDESALRRGHQTANHVWGNQASVLVGDFLYSRAFELMVSVNQMRVMDIMSKTTNVIASGEVLQLVANNQEADLTQTDYFKIIERKTAQLFSASAEIGGFLNESNSTQTERLAQFGFKLGRAFQIIDDLLDFVGDVQTTGKNVGDDIKNGKLTLPVLFLLEQGTPEQRVLIKSCCDELEDNKLGQLVELIQRSGALDYSRQIAKDDMNDCRILLKQLPQNPINKALNDLCDFVLAREF